MKIRRDTFGATVRLAAVLSTIAAFLAIGLESVGDVSATALAATVAVIGFASSWVLTGRTVRPVHAVRHHRVSVVPVRHRVG